MTDNSKPMSEDQKSDGRAKRKAASDDQISIIKQIYNITKAPYMDEGVYCKDYRYWEIGDLARIDKEVLEGLHQMAEIDDDAHLKQILPKRYNGKLTDLNGPGGGVERFKHHIEATYYGNDRGYFGVIERPPAQRPEKFKDLPYEPRTRRHGSAIDVKDLSPNICINKAEALDQQAALVLLDQNGVKADATHELKKPLETAVTDAVKGLKSAITLAA